MSPTKRVNRLNAQFRQWRDTWRELFHIALWELGFLCITDSYMMSNLLIVFANLQIAQLVAARFLPLLTLCFQVEKCTYTYSKVGVST